MKQENEITRESSDEEIDNMTKTQAADILKRQVDSYYRGGDYRPRKHMAKALEIAIQKLRDQFNTKLGFYQNTRRRNRHEGSGY